MGEPFWSGRRHMDMVFQTNTELVRDYDHRFVGKAHAFSERERIATNDVWGLMNFQTKAVTGAPHFCSAISTILIARSTPAQKPRGAAR